MRAGISSVLVCGACVALTPVALAQDDSDRGFIVGLLEDALGGEGRSVRIDGFAGALSSTATVDRITIADPDGVWLTVEDVTLTWTRSALLQGAIDIQTLSAARIDMPRPPVPVDTGLPVPEAQGFSLPDLPVSVEIDSLQADRITLGAEVLGQAAALSLQSAVRLADGAGDVRLTASRLDGPDGAFDLTARYANATTALAVDLSFVEGPGGLAVTLLDLPGAPDVDLSIEGTGTLSDFSADLALATEGTPRVTGDIRLFERDAQGALAFAADLSGDVTALVDSPLQPFFGPSSVVRASGARFPDGALSLQSLDIATAMLDLTGTADLRPDGVPQRVALTGRLSDPAGAPVRLPVAGPALTLGSALLDVQFDAASSNRWDARIAVQEVQHGDEGVARLDLTGRGTLDAGPVGLAALNGDFDFGATGLMLSDPALAKALGADVNGVVRVEYGSDQPVRLRNLQLQGAGLTVAGQADLAGLDEAFRTAFDLSAQADSLARFDALSGLALRGAADLRVVGEADAGGFVDAQLTGTTQDLQIGQAQADAVLAGRGTVDLDLRRDATGVLLRRLQVTTPEAEVTADGRLASGSGALSYALALRDAGVIVPDVRGPVTLTGQADVAAEGLATQADLTGPYGLNGSIDANLRGTPTVRFDLGLPDVADLRVPYRGPLRLTGVATQPDARWQADLDLTGPYGLTGQVEARLQGAAQVDYRLTLPDVARVGAPFAGPLQLQGAVTQRGESWQTSTRVQGPAGLRADVNGAVAPTVALEAQGQVPLGLFNQLAAPRNVQGQAAFDLALRNGFGPRNLSGQVALSDARIVSPSERLSLRNGVGTVRLANGRAEIDFAARGRRGGRLTVAGPVALEAGGTADLRIGLSEIVVEDPQLYETDVSGQVRFVGPVSGGARITGDLSLGETRVSIPTTFLSAAGVIPDITHIGATRPVLRTQERAGLRGSGSSGAASGTARPHGLDLTITAPGRIFVRGRGLDAELGGALQLGGTTANIVSSGGADLIRGRLDILGKRFVLDEGRVQLLGDFDPFLRFVASTATETGTASVIVEGRASSPEVRFVSTPSLPEDEVLAQLLFGRGIQQLSALQALELANAVATLAGRGGAGIVGRLRESFDLDDLDITSDNAGNTQLRAGKYISDNVYTDVTVGQDNRSSVSINIDLTPNVTARGTLRGDGETSLGIFYEKDY